LSSNDGEFVTSTTKFGLGQYLLEAFACEAINPGRWRSRHDVVSARLELGCKLATDEAGPAYDYDFHF
jgi:hypothetical protein